MQEDYLDSIIRRQQPIVKSHVKYGNLRKMARLMPSSERTLAPSKIGAGKSPHLSPVGSLTNLLTDLSSTGWKQT
jgi:hypothetical protein